MSNNVVTHEKFGGAKALRDAGIDVAETVSTEQVTEMKLPEPKYGEVILGDLTEDEAATFRKFWETSQEYDDIFRSTLGDALAGFGSGIKESDRSRPLNDLLQEGKIKMEFQREEDAETFFRLEQLKAYLHATLYFGLGERFKEHKSRIGIRRPKKGETALRAVTIERRY